MQLVRPHPNRETIDALLRYLAAATGSEAEESWVERATLTAEDHARPETALIHALPVLGMRGSDLLASVDEAAPRSLAEMPLVTYVASEVDPAWLVLDGWRFGRVHVWSTSPFIPSGWSRIDELVTRFGDAALHWVRVESGMPARSLAGRDEGASPLRRLIGLLRAERGAIGVVVVYAVAVGILALATPLTIQIFINWLAFGALYQPIVVLSIGLLLALTLATALRGAQRFAVELVQRRIFVRTVSELGARITRVRVAGLDDEYGPELVNRFFDVLTLQKATKTLLLDGLTAALQASVGLLLLALYHPYFLVFDVVVIGLAMAALIPFLRRGEETAVLESKKKYAVAAWIEEIARHPAVFKTAGSPFAEARLERLSREYIDKRASHFRLFFLQYIGMQGVAIVVQVGLLLTAGYLVLEGQLTLGQLVAAEFIVASALAGLSKFTDKLETVYDLLAGVDKLGTLMDLPPERSQGVTVPSGEQGTRIELKNVAYRWKSRAPLSDASAILPAGSRTAIVGRTGSGKSLIAELITGMREPVSGSVWRDGVPLDRQLPDSVFDQTMLIRRHGLIHATVRENISLGRHIAEADIWAALDDLGRADCIQALSQGLDTSIGVFGKPLSECQAIDLLLARALVDPKPLIVIDGLFDGPSDRERARLDRFLEHLPTGVTLVLLTEEATLAHRFDSIYEIHNGGLHARPRLTHV